MKDQFPKPYWHVDAKWVFGLLLLVALIGTSVMLFLSKVTTRENAISLGSLALATAFSREEGLDGTTSVDEFKKKAAEQEGEVINPLPDIPGIVITKTDLQQLSPRELRLKIFRQIIEPIYDLGIEGAAKKFTSDQAAVEKLTKDARLLEVFTETFHNKVSSFATILAFVTVVLLAGFIFFSFGWGKLGNPGFLLFIVGLPGLLIGTLLKNPPKDGDGGLTKFIPSEVGSALGTELQVTYGLSVGVGILLLFIALVGSIVTRRRKHTSDEQRNQ